jgi:hypothetical protein
MFKYLGLGAGLAVAVSLGYGIYAGVRSHLNLQIAYEAAQAQLSLNADLQAEVDRYAAQVAAIDRKYEDLRASIEEGRNETIASMDGPLGDVLRLVGVQCTSIPGGFASPGGDLGAGAGTP